MKNNDFYKQVKLREEKPLLKEDSIAREVFKEYLKRGGTDYPCKHLNQIEKLLYNYFQSKGTPSEKILLELFDANDFNYSASVRNAIFYLLCKPSDIEKQLARSVNPLFWPGINSITRCNYEYTLDTKIGKIKVCKASKVFKGTPSKCVFNRELIHHCHDRSEEFLKLNKDYQAVLSYVHNFFYGGMYHSYLESENGVLDIAANAYYENKEDASLVLKGDIIKKISYSEAQRKFETLSRIIPELKKHKKLGALTVYYDMKK